MTFSSLLTLLLTTLGSAEDAPPRTFETPFPLRVEEKWVLEMHASPTFFDWDEDGLPDLLLGVHNARCGGILKIYRNVGKPGAPAFEWLENFTVDEATPHLPGG